MPTNPFYEAEKTPKRKKKQHAKSAAAPSPEREVSKPTTTAASPKASEKPKHVRLTPRGTAGTSQSTRR